MSRNLYLDEIPLDEAKARFFGRLRELGLSGPVEGETVPVDIEAIGRITDEPVFARISSPHYHASAMDGVAVRSESTFGADERHHVELGVGKDAIWVDTGDPLPEGCDAVIMVEDLLHVGEESVTIAAPATPWQNVRVVGEDIVATELILPENHILRPQDIGAMLAGGVTRVRVRRKPRVAIIPTGDELVSLGGGGGRMSQSPGPEISPSGAINSHLSPASPPPGAIIEFNSQIIGGLVKEWGAEPVFCGIVPDDPGRIASALIEAARGADIVVINAGSSAGSQDYTSAVIKQHGEVLVHGVAIRPGKPVILGVAQGKPVLGIPGYAVSCALACELSLRPLIFAMLGRREPAPPTIKARMAQKLRSPGGVLEFLRVKVGAVGDRVVAVPIARGAGLVSSLVRADGVVKIPATHQGIEEGTEVTVELVKSWEEIRDTIVHVGSHDIALDLLATYLGRLFPGTSFSSAHVGSIGGLLCLRRGEAHVAGVHLLDPETGDYNVPYVKRFCGPGSWALVNLTYRQQGFIVRKGNPKGIRDIRDLARADVAFVNRQKGAGTRVLLDIKLKEAGISPEQVRGYGREEYTHMAVAAAVACGVADVGLGILAAADALGLDFIPVDQERYDLAVSAEFMESPHWQRLYTVITSRDYREAVEGLGGYELKETGRVMWRS